MSEYAGQQFVGIDLHRRRSVIVRTTGSGEVLESVRILNDVESLDRVIERAGEDPEVVLEATYGWYWAVDALREAGARVHLAHPLGVKAFEYRRVKNDFRDAADLADLLRMGRLPEAWIAPPATRELRELVRHRAKLVALRSHCKAEIHADRVAAAADGRSGLRDRGVHQCGPGSPRCRSRIPRGAADPGHRSDPGSGVRRRGRRRHPVRPPRRSWRAGPGSPPSTTSPTPTCGAAGSPSRDLGWSAGRRWNRSSVWAPTPGSVPYGTGSLSAGAATSARSRPPGNRSSTSSTRCATATSARSSTRLETRHDGCQGLPVGRGSCRS